VTTNEAIRNIYRKVNGEIDNNVTFTSDDGQIILQIINEKINEFQNTIDSNGELVLWRSTYDPEYEVDVISTSRFYTLSQNDVFTIDDGYEEAILLVDYLSEEPPIIYRLADISTVNRASAVGKAISPNVCTITRSGLTFPYSFTEDDDEYGRTIVAPIYRKCKMLTKADDNIEKLTMIPNVYWLIAASAAEYARNDVVKGGEYANILAQANNLMLQMININRSTQYLEEVNTEELWGLNYGGLRRG
jgi:hypothetical protein